MNFFVCRGRNHIFETTNYDTKCGFMMAESDSRLNVVKSSPDPQILNQFHQQVVLEKSLSSP